MELCSNVESQKRKVIYFSSGETLEENESEEEEIAEQLHQCSFSEENLSWRGYAWFWGSQVMLKSFQTCDFLGGKLAGLLGLNLAKYQYAIDEYQHIHKHEMEKEETLLCHSVSSAYGSTDF